MYKRILIATDGSELAGQAVEHGLVLAKSVGAEVVFVTVSEAWSPLDLSRETEQDSIEVVEVFENAATRAASKILSAAKRRAGQMGVPSQTRHLRDHRPAEGILETAELDECDLIVMASHGHRGLKRMLVGSQTAEVIALSKHPVLVLR